MLNNLAHTMKRLIVSDNKAFHCFLRTELKIKTKSPRLYNQAVLHRSASVPYNKNTNINNERLEYLGDAILGAIVADYLFHKFPSRNEGFLTQVRSRLVKRANLEDIADKMGLDRIILLNNKMSGHKKRIYGDALEALIGAMFLDKGYDKTRKYVINHIIRKYVDINTIISRETDFKSRLIEWGQKYRVSVVFDTSGNINIPESKNHVYKTCVLMPTGTQIGKGIGLSKKEAEQNAAEQALEFIAKENFIPEISDNNGSCNNN